MLIYAEGGGDFSFEVGSRSEDGIKVILEQGQFIFRNNQVSGKIFSRT